MDDNSVCIHCKRLKTDHTKNELISCALKNGKNMEVESSESEIIDDFNKIKTGEVFRMRESLRKSKK